MDEDLARIASDVVRTVVVKRSTSSGTTKNLLDNVYVQEGAKKVFL